MPRIPRTDLAASRHWPPFVRPGAELGCSDADPELFFPAPGQIPTEALRLCAGCAERRACLLFALETGQRFGVWGGTTAGQRHGGSR